MKLYLKVGILVLLCLPCCFSNEMNMEILDLSFERSLNNSNSSFEYIGKILEEKNAFFLADLAIQLENKYRYENSKHSLSEKSQLKIYKMTKSYLIELVRGLIFSLMDKNNKRNLFFGNNFLFDKKFILNAFRSVSLMTNKLENPKFFEKNIANNLKVDKITTNKISGQRHAHTHMKINGLKVWNKEIILHLDKSNDNDEAKSGDFVDTVIKDISEYNPDYEYFENLAKEQHGTECPLESELILYEHNKELRPTIRVHMDCLDQDPPSIPNFFIDLETKEVLHVLNDFETILYRKTYDAINSQVLQRSFLLDEEDDKSGDSIADKIHENMKKIYEYFWYTFQRDSYDDEGAELKSTVHYGKNFNNAFFDGNKNFAFGDGDKKIYGPITALDIASHEFAHAIIKSESKLLYENESGAINESLSDIFAACVDAHVNGESEKTYTIGEDIFLSKGSIRSMSNPSSTGDYDYYPTRYTGTSDNGGVHLNSGISNLAFYLLCRGGRHPRNVNPTVVPKIGIQKACKIFYFANEDYLVSNSGFFDTRHATISASDEIFGKNSTESKAISLAWEAVGIYENWILKKRYVKLSSTSDESYSFSITENSPSMNFKIKFKIFGPNGDADLYIRKDTKPTPDIYDCRPFLVSSNEECILEQPGTYFIVISGYTKFTNLTFEYYVLEL